MRKLFSRKFAIALVVAASVLSIGVSFTMYKGWQQTPEPARQAFYFWKTRWAPSPRELAALKELRVQSLYLRFFDVQINRVTHDVEPVAALRFEAPIPQNLRIVPVIYIKNEVFLARPAISAETLAANVWQKIREMATEGHIALTEVQLDCDWSDASKNAYFAFLKAFKAEAGDRILSATIRLHQVKYRSITGVPPVERGMLMFYNMGKIAPAGEQLSIYNSQDARRYTSQIHSYPLDLDLALPIFSWVVHSRNERLLGLIDRLDEEEIGHHTGFTAVSSSRYLANRSFFLHGLFFKRGDLLSVEQVTPKLTMEAAHLAATSTRRKLAYQTVALFDLNERNIKHYETPQLQKIFNIFR